MSALFDNIDAGDVVKILGAIVTILAAILT